MARTFAGFHKMTHLPITNPVLCGGAVPHVQGASLILKKAEASADVAADSLHNWLLTNDNSVKMYSTQGEANCVLPPPKWMVNSVEVSCIWVDRPLYVETLRATSVQPVP